MRLRSSSLAIALPFLAVAYPIVTLWSVNAQLVHPEAALRVLAVALGLTGLAVIVAWRMTHRPLESALTVAVLGAVAMTFGHQVRALPEPVTMPLQLAVLAANAGIAAALAAFIWRRDTARPAAFLTVVLGIAVAFSLLGVAQGLPDPVASERQPGARAVAGPDVYFIVLDAYARADVLDELYGHDNEPFLGGLESRGFYVADDSYSNYAMTQLSLASTLNMDYLGEDPARRPADLDRAIQESSVVRAFQERGYRYAFFETSWFGTDEAPLADLSFPISEGGSRFEELAWQMTLPGRLLHAPERHLQLLRTLDGLEQIPQLPDPTFTVAHLLAPHPPFMFRADGSVRSYVEDLRQPFLRDEYAEQVEFLNERLDRLVDALIAESDQVPIIVLQGDHGPMMTLDGPATTAWWERHAILNAILVPESFRASLYPSISPVNTFRVILPLLAGDAPSLLDDLAYFNWYDRVDAPAVGDDPLELRDVTETLP